jgi:hypothetical protein
MASPSEFPIDLTAGWSVLSWFHSILHWRLETVVGPIPIAGRYDGSTVAHIAAFPVALSLQEERFLRLDRREERGQFLSGDFKSLRMALLLPA